MDMDDYMDDHMEYGSVIGRRDGWFYDVEAEEHFMVDDDGNIINEDGDVIRHIDDDLETFYDDEEYYE